MLKKLTTHSLMLFSMIGFANQEISMGVSRDRITNTRFPNANNVKFEAMASDNMIYDGSIACFSAPWNQGHITVKKSPTQAGVSTTIDYTYCNEILAGLRENSIQVKLSWDKKSFDEFTSGPLDYEVY